MENNQNDVSASLFMVSGAHKYSTSLHFYKNYNLLLTKKHLIKNLKLSQNYDKQFNISEDCNIHITSNNLPNGSVQLQKEISYEKNKDDKVAMNKTLGNLSIKKGRRYQPSFKKKVLEYVKSHTHKETAAHFNINNNTITEWLRENKKSLLEKRTNFKKVDFDETNNKTEKLITPETKTEIICLETENIDALLENNNNELKSSKLLPSSPSSSMIAVKPDEMFLKWVKKKRLQKKELSRQEVFKIAKYCLKKQSNNAEPSAWFVPWFNRFSKVLNSTKSNADIKKYIKYPSSFKLEVILYAQLFTKNSAARVFNVSRKRTFDWCSRIVSLEKSIEKHFSENEIIERNSLNFGSEKRMTKEKIYAELHLWYQTKFFNGCRPTSKDIKEKAREIFSFYNLEQIKFSDGWLQKFCRRTNIKLRHSEDDDLLMWILTQFDNNVSLSHHDITEKSSSLIGRKQFKGSKGWTLRFLKRHKNLLQHSPTFADQLPRSAEQKLTRFWNSFRQNVNRFKINAENIGCMDEVPLSFTYPEESNTFNLPLLRKTGFENYLGIVILSCLANGQLLPPAVVFKGSEPVQMFAVQNLNILVLYEENGLITSDLLEIWMNQIWLSRTSAPSALVIDSFEPHRTESLARMLANKNCFLHVIPEGCSSKFQPLDVNVTPTFKNCIKTQWKEFPASLEITSPKISKKYRCPDKNTILRWVQVAYEKSRISPVSIINSFKTTNLLTQDLVPQI